MNESHRYPCWCRDCLVPMYDQLTGEFLYMAPAPAQPQRPNDEESAE